jgi:hypothetical protein
LKQAAAHSIAAPFDRNIVVQTIPRTPMKSLHPMPAVRRLPATEPKITAMAGMTRDEVRRLVVSLIG